jgi:hypothetical protein
MGETMQRAFAKRHVIAKLNVAAIAAAALVITGASARAAIVTTVNLPALQDVTLFGGGDATNNNTSSGPGMFVGSDGGSPNRGLIEFDIADNIPAGATVTSATLSLTLGMVAGSGGSTDPTKGDGPNQRTIQIFVATSPWSGTTLGSTTTNTLSNPFGGTGHGSSPPNLGDTTWNWESYNTQHWNTVGGGGDFVSTASASLTFAPDLSVRGDAYSWSSDQMVADVQGWLDGSVANDGWLLKNTEEAVQSFRAFFTREGAIAEGAPNFQPQLSVTFIVPEPASMSLLVLGAPLLLRRRRTLA